MADTEINPLLFIFLGTIIASISAGVIYWRQDYLFTVFLAVGLAFVGYGFARRAIFTKKAKRERKKVKKQMNKIPGLNKKQTANISNRAQHVHHQNKEQFKSHHPNLKIVKHCSHCHKPWGEHDYVCRACNSRHCYYMSHNG